MKKTEMERLNKKLQERYDMLVNQRDALGAKDRDIQSVILGRLEAQGNIALIVKFMQEEAKNNQAIETNEKAIDERVTPNPNINSKEFTKA